MYDHIMVDNISFLNMMLELNYQDKSLTYMRLYRSEQDKFHSYMRLHRS